MTEEPVNARHNEHGPDPSDGADLRLDDLMRRAFSKDQDVGDVDVLAGVQERLRERSGGKFYGDGWSRTRLPPFSTFFVTSLMMLAIVAIIYAVLVPVVGVPVDDVPPLPSTVDSRAH